MKLYSVLSIRVNALRRVVNRLPNSRGLDLRDGGLKHRMSDAPPPQRNSVLQTSKRWLIRAGLAATALVGVFAFAIFLSAQLTRIPGEEITPSGLKRNQAVYVTMKDGVRIAIDIWMPKTIDTGERAPAILHMTRYQRAQSVGWLQRAVAGLRLSSQPDLPGLQGRLFNDAGFVFIQVDARGSGASFGHRDIEMAPREINDYGELADWIVRQPWSNGKVGAVGVSYSGNTAELLAAVQHPAVTAVAPLYNDFDAQYGLVQPGGAKSTFLKAWGDTVGKLDRNDVCALAGKTGLSCILARFWSPGVKPVDGKDGKLLLKAALKDHAKNTPVAEGFERIQYRDDTYGATNLTSAAVSGYGRREEIEASGAIFHVRTGWLDAATTDGALSRYRTFSNSQELIIGPYSHGGRTDSDPFSDPDAVVAPSLADQWREIIRFFERAFANDEALNGKNIKYYTMGAGVWRETERWPPADLTEETYYFAANGALTEAAPEGDAAADSYIVDMKASSGEHTRWHTNLGLGDVVYPDRAAEDERLLTYTSAPLTADLEITGTPVLTFYVATNTQDAVFHAYLEAVAPDGRVIYLTEGVLRALHRKVSDEEPVYVQDGPHHSFLRKDASPMTPGVLTEIAMKLYATSIVVPKNYRLRIALAGADLSIFEPVAADGEMTWEIYRNAAYPSRIVLPSREFSK